jgi:hypothetical protein
VLNLNSSVTKDQFAVREDYSIIYGWQGSSVVLSWWYDDRDHWVALSPHIVRFELLVVTGTSAGVSIKQNLSNPNTFVVHTNSCRNAHDNYAYRLPVCRKHVHVAIHMRVDRYQYST